MRGLHAARAAMLAASLCYTGWAAAGPNAVTVQTAALVDRGAALAEFDPARMPSGLAELCSRDSSFCRVASGHVGYLALTPEQWKLLEDVNYEINHRIAPTTDQKLYGKVEYWTLPVKAGDCEDYVLLKRKTLIEQGFPESALLITVVNDENGAGHAVLSIPATGGDVVLDNRRDDVLRWWSTGYRFVKRQSASDPAKWVSLAREKLQATNIASAPEAP